MDMLQKYRYIGCNDSRFISSQFKLSGMKVTSGFYDEVIRQQNRF